MMRTKTEIELHPLRVTVHQGGHEIGGNLVEVCHEDGSTLILDLGLPLFDGAEDRPFPLRMEDLAQDKVGALKTLRAMGVAPAGLGIFVDEEPRPDTAVCISHAHADHWGLLPLLRQGTSVLASAETRGLIESQCAWKRIPLPKLAWFELDGDSALSIGKLNLESHSVDHSVPGALAFSIEGGGTRVIYTGDLRFASLKQVHTLVDEMKRHPDLLLCEGTRLGETGGARLGGGEGALLTPLREAMEGAKGLVTFACSAPHLERLAILRAAAELAGRFCAIDLYTAYVLLKAGRSLDGYRLLWTRGYVLSGLKLIQELGAEAACEAARVHLTQIEKAPERWLLALRGGMLRDLERWESNNWGRLPGPALHLHSLWRGYRTMESSARLEGFLASRGARVMDDGVHASGHASEMELKELVRLLRPVRTLGLHSFHPELLSDKEAL